MSPPEVWGPPIWTLFHVLAEKINERLYPFYAGQLLNVVKHICSALPCPECTNDATIFLSKIKLQDLKTKDDFKKMIYIFHNYVNVKKRKPLYNYSNLEIYKKYNIINVFNRFISVYHTRGNMKLLAESFQRQNIIKHVKEWFSKNIMAFVQFQPQAPIVSQENTIEIKPITQDETFVIIEEIEDVSIKQLVNDVVDEVCNPQVNEVCNPQINEESNQPINEVLNQNSKEDKLLKDITSYNHALHQPSTYDDTSAHIPESFPYILSVTQSKTKKGKKKKH